MPIVTTPIGRIDMSIMGEGPIAVVLLHAAAGNPRALHKLAALLANDRRRIVVPALDGYGDTRIDAIGTSLERNIALVSATMAACGTRQSPSSAIRWAV